jgi:hypothetical protein
MNKINLFIILISSIIFSLLTRVVEGACNYNFNSNTSKGKEQQKLFCNNSMIGTTKLRQSEFKNKVNSLSSLVNTTESQIMKNQKLILQNTKNNIALKAVSDPNADEDTSDACKQYPIAC